MFSGIYKAMYSSVVGICFIHQFDYNFVFNHDVNNYYMVTFVLGAHGGAVV
jgi:hypothetical protein